MNKRIFLTLIFVLTVALSVGTIYASDVNVTDSYASSSQDDGLITLSDDSSELQATEAVVDNDSSNDVLKSEDSNTLSTNTEDSNVLTSDNNAPSTIDVSKTVTANDVTKYYKGSAKYTATFLDINGSALANTNVKITLNGKEYTQMTNSRGVASLSIDLKPGTYKVVATNPDTGYSLTNTVKILSTIVSSDMSKVYTDGKKFTATFLKSNGKALAKKTVKFRINGKTYKVKTNSKGKASLSLTKLRKGTYKIISYNADGSKKTNKVKVIRTSKTSLTSKDYLFLKKDKKRVKVKLLNQLGYAPAKGKVIRLALNGKKYSAKTNAKGIASFKLPSLKNGVYTMKYSFAKSSYYKASSVKNRLTVIPTKKVTYTVKSTTVFGHGAGTLYKVALTSGGVPIANKKVTLTINGQTQTQVTNSKGIVSIPINLDIGNYEIKFSNKADSKLNSQSGITAISVVERTPTSVSWKSETTIYEGSQSWLKPLQMVMQPLKQHSLREPLRFHIHSPVTT